MQGIQQYDRLGNEKWQDVPVSHDSANVLHKVKQEIDNVVNYDAPGLGVPAGALSRQQGALKEMRSAINDTLELQVPGYKNANAVSAALAKRGEAVQAGTQYLGSGKTTPSPDRFAAAFDPLSQGEKIAFAKGSRGEVDRVLGVKGNDLQALRGELQGEGGWNQAKLATVHGQPAADELASSVDRNLAFRSTFNDIVKNSQTAQRQAASAAMRPLPPGEIPIVNPNSSAVGIPLAIVKKGLGAAWNAVRPDQANSFGEVARALTEQGAKRDARIQSIVEALDKRSANSQLATTAGNGVALLGAIAGSADAQAHRKRSQK